MNDVEIRRADWDLDRAALRHVRTRVFIEEQKVPAELEWDELDHTSLHVLALAGDEPVGTGRLTPDGHIGRMAVMPSWRGRGVGAALLQHLMQVARARGDAACELNAQVSAVGFYERFGFRAEGEEFMDAGIPHRLMRLAYADHPGQRLDSHGTMAEALLRIARDARHEFGLYAPDLAPRLTDSLELAAALKDLVLSSRRGSVRLLVADARSAAAGGNALLRLVVALPSRCELRQLCPEDEPDDEVYAFNDAGTSFHQPRAEAATGILVRGSPLASRELRHRFDLQWERAEPAPDGRRIEL